MDSYTAKSGAGVYGKSVTKWMYFHIQEQNHLVHGV